MKKNFIAVTLILIALAVGFSITYADQTANTQALKNQIIARERAAFEAWQRKDKAFFADYMAEDATYFGPISPYLEVDPKENFLPKFEEFAEQFKYQNFQMYNPRVQIYGDTAVLTYNSSVTATANGQPINYTAKNTAVYVKQGNTWRVVHAHESMNPGMR